MEDRAGYYRDIAKAYQASESALRRRIEKMRASLKKMCDSWVWDEEQKCWHVTGDFEHPDHILRVDDIAVSAQLDSEIKR